MAYRQKKIKEACGVFGIYAPGENIAKIIFFGLLSLQHRGQEGSGIAVGDGTKINLIKGLGFVTQVFNENNLSFLKGFVGLGHTRYSTTGSNSYSNVQPILIKNKNYQLAIGHNGNIINSEKLKNDLKKINFSSTTDSEIMGWVIIKSKGKTLEEKIINSLPNFIGAYSLIVLTKEKLFALRDPLGFKPLVLGRLNGGYVVCSETCALDTVGAKYIRDVKPGEIILIDNNGAKPIWQINSKKRSFCLFEYVYFARPDSIINREVVNDVRKRSGTILAYEAPVNADLVSSVPDSGTSAAVGYSKASGIPFEEVLIKNRYIGRTFIQPDQRIRELGVKIKFNPLKKVINKKRIILVDDSIVRGTTMKKLVTVLRAAGAKKIHLRICSPPIRFPCYYGVDTPIQSQLIAAEKDIKSIKKFLNVDSLKYLSLRSLIKATRQKESVFCTACFSGKYPTVINKNFSKSILEPKKLAVLISNIGKGSNLQAIINAIKEKNLNAKISVVISDTKEAFGLQRAKKYQIPTLVVNDNDNLINILKNKYQVDFICLAGWKKIIPEKMINIFQNRILNIHPGLIPDELNGKVKNPDGTKALWNRGKLANQAIKNFLDKRATYAGSTVHFLSKEFDFGPVLARCFEKIKPNDTINSLYGRLKKKENKIYVQALIKICNN